MYKAFLLIFCSCSLFANHITLKNGTVITFATVEQGQKVLGAKDDYIQEMSPMDCSIRLKTDKSTSTSDFLNAVKKTVLTWTPKERKRMSGLLRKSKPSLDRYSLKLPKSILLIKTSGKSEANAPYTRANAIIFPVRELESPDTRIEELIYHEIFHILTRYNPVLRDELYKVIGFTKKVNIDFPTQLANQKITNPDAPRNLHCLQLIYNGEFYWAMPIIYSKSKKYDVTKNRSLFACIELKILLAHKTNKNGKILGLYDKDKTLIVDLRHVNGFFQQVGFNTQYIIHPEEVLADNFAYLCLDKKVRSPHVTNGIKSVLKRKESRN